MNSIIEKYKGKFRKDSFLYQFCKKVYLFLLHLFYPCGYIRNYVLFPIAAFLRVNHLWPWYNKNAQMIEGLKDIHKGKRCFILCQGPSLTLEDCERLANEYTFGLNAFFRSYGQTAFRPSFYVTLDPDGAKAWKKTDNFNPEHYARIASFINIQSKGQDEFKNTIYVPVCYQNHFYRIFSPGFDYGKNCKMSDDLLWGIYDRYSVTNGAIDIAVYMGFKEIYLLGADNNYAGPKAHFNDKDSKGGFATSDQAEMTHKAMEAGYAYTEKATRKRGVHVYNATRGGMLEIFERVDFDSLVV